MDGLVYQHLSITANLAFSSESRGREIALVRVVMGKRRITVPSGGWWRMGQWPCSYALYGSRYGLE